MPYHVKLTAPNYEKGTHIQLDMLGEFVVGDDENNIIQDEDAARYCQSRLISEPIYDDSGRLVDTRVTVPKFMDLVPYIYGVEITEFDFTSDEVKAQEDADKAAAQKAADDALRAQQAYGNANIPNVVAEFDPDQELVANASDNTQAVVQPVTDADSNSSVSPAPVADSGSTPGPDAAPDSNAQAPTASSDAGTNPLDLSAPGGQSEQDSARTTYKHVGSNAIDVASWPDTGKKDADGNELYTFVGDNSPTDVNGVSDEWVVSSPATSEGGSN